MPTHRSISAPAIGMTFGRLVVIGDAVRHVSPKGKKTPYIPVRCSCGTIKDVAWSCLKGGSTISCGCAAREMTSNRSLTHGETRTRLYGIWRNMKQ